MPVAPEADNRALERAYREVRPAPGAPVLILLEGRIAQRMPMEGPGPVDTLIPERFLGLRPDATCADPVAVPPLANTYWKLRQLGGTAAEVLPERREPHLVLHEDARRLAGSDGCNRLAGGWESTGAALEFGPLAATRMACAEGMAQARRFAEALEATVRYRIVGRQLELLDAAGTRLARFEAVALQ